MKTLKLTGLTRFIAPFTKFNAIQKGQVIAVDDALADLLLEGFESSRDRGTYPHFEEVSGEPVHFDYTTATAAVVAEVKVKAIEVAKAEAAAVPPTPEETELAARLAAVAETSEPQAVTESDAPAPAVAPVVASVAEVKKPSQRVARKASK